MRSVVAAGAFELFVAWIPTDRNPADRPSSLHVVRAPASIRELEASAVLPSLSPVVIAPLSIVSHLKPVSSCIYFVELGVPEGKAGLFAREAERQAEAAGLQARSIVLHEKFGNSRSWTSKQSGTGC